MLATRARMVSEVGLPRGTVFNFPYTGGVQEIKLPRGRYRLEVWGAEGADTGNFAQKPGLGGYSRGNLMLAGERHIFLYTGGKGGIKSGGWNGGGDSRGTGSSASIGGGGTDIRIQGDSLYHRIIVAGGGGATGSIKDDTAGAGGGLSGVDSVIRGNRKSSGGGQTQGGDILSGGSISGSRGAFGKGGTGYGNDGGSGGGGWYGGGGSYGASAGGGSGYIHTPTSHKPSGWKLTEEHYLTDAETIAGNSSMPSPSGGTQTGHSGNGYARITVI